MKTKAFLYCRKSSEGEERQMLSIPSQKAELSKLLKMYALQIVDQPIEESQSAKAPGREKFNQLLKRIENGEANKIVVWHVDRLSRNAVDTGALIDMIDRGKIEEIITPSQIFRNTPNDKFMLSLLCGQAKLENDQKGINAKRGMNTKAEMGWLPQHAPVGYINTPDRKKGFKVIEKDPIRFDIAKRCFQEVINGKNAMAVYELATKEWGLTNPSTGKPIATSTFYKMLNHPFYYGEFFWNNQWHNGEHEAMITKEDFDVVQRMLGNRGKPVQRAQTFDLTGLFRCEQCKCALTASRKIKFYKGTKRQVTYVYYHCTKKNKSVKCTQKPIPESEMTKRIVEQLLKAKPPQAFIDWAKKWVSFLHQHESQFQENMLKNNHGEVERIENRLNKLLDLYINEGISEETYKSKKEELDRLRLDAQKKVDETGGHLTNWRVKVENVLDYAEAMARKFEKGKKDVRHEILIKVSSDLTYQSKNPLILLKKEYNAIKKLNEGKFDEVVSAQTSKYADVFVQRPDLVPANSTWLPD